MRLVIGSDHFGWKLKQDVMDHLAKRGHQVADVGCLDDQPVDFPDIARQLVARIRSARQAERGLMVCGTGVGAAIAANKVKGIRASVCHDVHSRAPVGRA